MAGADHQRRVMQQMMERAKAKAPGPSGVAADGRANSVQSNQSQQEKIYMKFKIGSIRLNPDNTRLKLRKICTKDFMEQVKKLDVVLADPKNKRRLNEADDVIEALWADVYKAEFERLAQYVEETNKLYIKEQFKKLLELALDIYTTKGATQAIEVHKIHTEYYLISGERRLAATALAGLDEIGGLKVDTKLLAEKYGLLEAGETDRSVIEKAQKEAVILSVYSENRSREDVTLLEKILSFEQQKRFIENSYPDLDMPAVRRRLQAITGYNKQDITRLTSIIGKNKEKLVSMVDAGVFEGLYPVYVMEKMIRDLDGVKTDEYIDMVYLAFEEKGAPLSRVDMTKISIRAKEHPVSKNKSLENHRQVNPSETDSSSIEPGANGANGGSMSGAQNSEQGGLEKQEQETRVSPKPGGVTGGGDNSRPASQIHGGRKHGVIGSGIRCDRGKLDEVLIKLGWCTEDQCLTMKDAEAIRLVFDGAGLSLDES